MPLWLQILSAIFGAIFGVIGTTLGILNWREKQERLDMFCVDWNLKKFCVYNPMTHPVMLRSIAFETWSKEKGSWVESPQKSGLPTCPTTLQPFTGHDFELSTPQSLDVAFYRRSQLRVRTGSNKEFKKRFDP